MTSEPKGARASRTATQRPPLWLRTSVTTGIITQCGAITVGALLVAVAAGLLRVDTGVREIALLVGFLLIYLNTHAIGHWIVGRLVGIRFRGFGLRGTDHPESYPQGLRQLMSLLPMWVAMTEPESRRHASGRARAAMYAAGETSTTVCSILTAGVAYLAHAPWGLGLLIFAVLWNLGASLVVSVIDKGDYAKAWDSLRAR